MAKLSPSIGFSSATGSVSASTFLPSRSGQTLRNKGFKSQTTSPLQQRRAARLGSLAQSWRALSDPQRLRWIEAANSQKHHPGGLQPNVSGFQFYLSCNLNLLEIGSGISSTPPALLALPQIRLTANPFQLQAIPLALNVQVGNSAPVNGTRVLAATAPLSPGLRSPKGQTFRVVRTGMGNGLLNELSFYVAQWYMPGDEDDRKVIWWKAYVITAGGLRSAFTYASSVIDAGIIP